jgi:hypothetical protein
MLVINRFWTHFGSFDGPMLLTHENSETGKFLAKQFNELRMMSAGLIQPLGLYQGR